MTKFNSRLSACAIAASALLAACGGGGTTPGTDNNTSAVSGDTGTCTAAPCINFGESTLGMVDFGGLGIEVANDPADASNKVAKLTKATDDETWAGVTVHLGGTGNSVTRIDPAEGITLRVYSPAAGLPIMVKIENASNSDAFVEATASTTKAGEWETLTFTYAAANTATTYNKVNVFPGFGTRFDEVYYIDELKYTAKATDSVTPSGTSGSTGTCTAAPCINFGESNLGMVDFGGLGIEVANDPADANNKVAKLTKATDDEPWAGVTVHLGGTGNSVTRIDPAQGITLRVYSPATDLPIMVKIEDASDSNKFKEATSTSTKAGEWETLTFNYPAADSATTYNKVSVFPGFNTKLNEIYHIDELKYTAKAADSGSSNATGPTAAALAPTASSANVVSIFSDTYTNIAVNEWGPDWGPSSARVSDGAVAGNNFKSIDMTAAGQEFGAASFTDNKFDASSFTHFNMDYWLDAPLLAGQVVTIKLSNHDGGAETSAVDYEVLPVVGGSWQRLAIPLSSFNIAGGGSASRNNIAQLVITAPRTNNGLPLKMYIDNVYFSK